MCFPEDADHSKGDVGGGGGFPNAPFVVGKDEHVSHCQFLLHNEPDEIRCCWQGLRRGVLYCTGSLAGGAASLQGIGERIQALPGTRKSQFQIELFVKRANCSR